jgi:hypothetical protein
MVVKKGEDLISHENTLKVKSQSTRVVRMGGGFDP